MSQFAPEAFTIICSHLNVLVSYFSQCSCIYISTTHYSSYNFSFSNGIIMSLLSSCAEVFPMCKFLSSDIIGRGCANGKVCAGSADDTNCREQFGSPWLGSGRLHDRSRCRSTRRGEAGTPARHRPMPPLIISIPVILSIRVGSFLSPTSPPAGREEEANGGSPHPQSYVSSSLEQSNSSFFSRWLTRL